MTPRRSRHPKAALGVALFVLTSAGCAEASSPGVTAATTTTTAAIAEPPTTETTAPPPPTTTEPEPTPTGATDKERHVDAGVIVVPHRGADGGAPWVKVAAIPYGTDPSSVRRTSIGEGEWIAADACASDPSGDFWIMEASPARFARFDRSGALVEQHILPARLLVDGRYFPYSGLTVTQSGALVTTRFGDDDNTYLLVYQDDEFTEHDLALEALSLAGSVESTVFLHRPTGGVVAVRLGSGVLDMETEDAARAWPEISWRGNRLGISTGQTTVAVDVEANDRADAVVPWAADVVLVGPAAAVVVLTGATDSGGEYGATLAIDFETATLTEPQPLPAATPSWSERTTSGLFVDSATNALTKCVAADDQLSILQVRLEQPAP